MLTVSPTYSDTDLSDPTSDFCIPTRPSTHHPLDTPNSVRTEGSLGHVVQTKTPKNPRRGLWLLYIFTNLWSLTSSFSNWKITGPYCSPATRGLSVTPLHRWTIQGSGSRFSSAVLQSQPNLQMSFCISSYTLHLLQKMFNPYSPKPLSTPHLHHSRWSREPAHTV